jgi:hypothetical protein
MKKDTREGSGLTVGVDLGDRWSRYCVLDPQGQIHWVKLHGGESGPFKHATIRPDIEGMTPGIDALSATEVRPGLTLVIEGENVFAERRGEVAFRFGSQVIAGDVSEWQDGYIAVTIRGGNHGLTRTEGTVVVRNHFGLQATKTITFTPLLATQVLSHRRPGVASWIGYKGERDDFDMQLKNGWTVKENTLACDGFAVAGYGCRFVTQASPGGTDALWRIMIWVDFMGTVDSTNFLTIEGPAGLDWK